MRQLGWIAAAMVMAAGAVVISGWPALTELKRSRTWVVEQVDASEAQLDGVTLRIDTARSLSFKARPERTVIWLRLGVGGDPETLQSWLGCDLALVDMRGKRWLPLANDTGTQVIKLLSGEPIPGLSCGQAAYRASTDGVEALSDQAFLVPTEVADALRVQISGINVRTRAVSLPLAAEAQPPM